MKARYLSLCVMVIMAIAAVSPALADDPPQVEKGWNLVSVTCDVSLENFKQRLGNDEIEVFTWNGEEYVAVDALRRGYGYVLNSNAVLNSSSICGGQAEEWTTTVEIKEGWNLIGNPYHQPVKISELLGESADSFSDLMFEYQGNKYREITKEDNIKVWRAIWVYSYKDLSLNYEIDCSELVISLASPEEPAIEVGDSASFTAACTTENGDADVTKSALWFLSDFKVLTGGDAPGVFAAIGAGSCGVAAEYKKKDSNTITVTVTAPAPVLVSISLTADKAEIEKGEISTLTVSGLYSDGNTADLTDEAELSLGSNGIGTLDGNVFMGMSPGIETVTATVGGLMDSTKIKVAEPGRKIAYLHLSGYPLAIEIYDTAIFYVYAYYTDGGRERVTANVEWVYDQSAGRIETNGMFYPAKLGTFAVKAVLGDVESNTVEITVLEKQLIWLGIHAESNNNLKPLPCPDYFGYYFCYSNHYIEVGKTGKFYAEADYNNDTRRTVTDEVELWESANPEVLTIGAGGYVTAHQTGTVAVRAYMEGVYSEWSLIQVIDADTQEFLLLEMSNRETILQPGESREMNATYYKRSDGIVDRYKVYKNEITDGIFTSLRVTGESDWTVTETGVGSFSAAEGEFTGIAPGTTDVFAQYAGLTSNSVEMEVWKPGDIMFCSSDGDSPEATWTDNKTVARLAVDCNTYEAGEEVNVVFDALLDDDEGRRVLDVCLDLYIYNSEQELVKIFRHENCSPTPLFRTLEGYTPVYNFGTAWDQTDEAGDAVPPGDYLAVARFYVLYCPVLKVPFTILGD